MSKKHKEKLVIVHNGKIIRPTDIRLIISMDGVFANKMMGNKETFEYWDKGYLIWKGSPDELASLFIKNRNQQ